MLTVIRTDMAGMNEAFHAIVDAALLNPIEIIDTKQFYNELIQGHLECELLGSSILIGYARALKTVGIYYPINSLLIIR